MRIAIVGAGIAGLSAALGLADHAEVVVLERRSAVAANAGAGIQLSPNAMKALAALGAADAVAAVAERPDALVVRAAGDAVPLVRLPYGNGVVNRFGAPALTAARAALHGTLLTLVKARGITLAYDVDVRAVRVSGERCEVARTDVVADLVIAADGVSSRLRAAFVGDAPRQSGWIAWRGRGRTMGPSTEVTMGAGHHLVRYALPGASNCVFVGTERRRGPRDVTATLLGRSMADVSDWVPWPIAVRPRHAFASGRIAFVGDAAHAMVPFLAQGAAMALEDAAVLTHAVATHGVSPRALQAYGSARLARTTNVARLSEQQGTIYHLGFPLAAARNTVMRRLGPRAIVTRMTPVWGWSPPAV